MIKKDIYIHLLNIFIFLLHTIFNKYIIKIQHTSVSSPLSICSRIISVYVLEPMSGVLPPVIKRN